MLSLLNPVYDLSDDYVSLQNKLIKGKVKSTKDELNLSRVRVDLGQWTKDVPEDTLPYAFPLFGLRGQSYPKIDEEVLVISMSDDLKSLFYVSWPGHSEFNDNKLQGFVDNFGSLFVVDTSTGDYKFWHKNGTLLTINSENKVTLNCKDLDISAMNSIDIKTKTLTINCDTLDTQASQSVSTTTNTINNTAGMIADSAMGAPAPTPAKTLESRG